MEKGIIDSNISLRNSKFLKQIFDKRNDSKVLIFDKNLSSYLLESTSGNVTGCYAMINRY